MDVGSSIVTDAETAELIQPCERPFDDPPPPSQAAAVCRATNRQQWQNAKLSGRTFCTFAREFSPPAARAIHGQL
jgi:hypothetical protein